MKPLSNFEIISICNKNKLLKKHFLGVFPRGKYVNRNLCKIPSFFIQNNDFMNEAGRHWLLILYTHKMTYFFDPFGFSPELYGFNLILERNNLPIIRSCKQIQSSTSNACGYHCIVVAFLILHKKSFHNILNNFYSTNLTDNDSKVYKIVKKWRNIKL